MIVIYWKRSKFKFFIEKAHKMVETEVDGQKKRVKKPLLMCLFMILLIGAYLSGLHEYLSFETLKNHYQDLIMWRAQHPIISAIGFVFIYAVCVALSLPGAVFLTIAGGLIFGLVMGTTLTVIGATIGAYAVFILARTIFKDSFERKFASRIDKFKQGFEDGAVSYLLMLRLIPVFPFWLVNILPSFFNVSSKLFIVTTALGIIPGSAVYTSIGTGFVAIIERGEKPDLSIIFDLSVLGPLIGLALLSALPLIYKKIKSKKADTPHVF